MNVASLIEQGYRVNEGEDRRRTGLNKAVHKYGYAAVVERIEGLAVISKNHKENRRRLEDDLEVLEDAVQRRIELSEKRFRSGNKKGAGKSFATSGRF